MAKIKVKSCFHCRKDFQCLSLKAKYCSVSCKNIQYNIKYPDRVAAQRLAWQRANKEYIRNKRLKPENHIAANLRSRLSKALSRNQKTVSMSEYLGCSLQELRSYIESLWQPGMSWDNYSVNGWHIDHIRPLKSFNLTDPQQIKIACHYTNLQPLWAHENRSKGDTHVE